MREREAKEVYNFTVMDRLTESIDTVTLYLCFYLRFSISLLNISAVLQLPVGLCFPISINPVAISINFVPPF